MILLCIVTIFSKSTTANADDRYVKLCERYFTEFAEDYGKFGQKDGFTYLYSDKKNTATIVAIPMEQKKVAVPEKINGKTVTKIELMYLAVAQITIFEMNFTENMRTIRFQRLST